MATISVRILNLKDSVLSWTFVDIAKTICSVEELYEDIKNGEFPGVKISSSKSCDNFKVTGCRTSVNHKLLEEVNASPVSDIVQKAKLFGMLYFTILVEHRDECEKCKVVEVPAASPKPSVQSFLMASARAQQANSLPKAIEAPKNRKEEQYNKILEQLGNKKCYFVKSAATTSARFMTKFSNALWYVDGHTDCMERESSRKFPVSFKGLLGFNVPEKSKHRKRAIANLSGDKLSELALGLKEAVQAMVFAKSEEWSSFKIECLKLSHMMEDYVSYLSTTKKKMIKIHSTPSSEVEKQANVKEIPITNSPFKRLRTLDAKLQGVDPFVPINVREFLEGPFDRKQIYDIIHTGLHLGGLSMKAVHYTYIPGGQKPALHFVWKVTENSEEVIQNCVNVIRQIEKNLPRYERRITLKTFKQTYGFVASSVALRSMFRDLARDESAPLNLSQAEIDERMNYALLSEDSGILVDLRNQSPSTKKDKFAAFFEAAERYLSNDVGVACHDRRHGEQLYLAKAISFADLHKRVKELVPEGTAIPSVKWLRYQFQPIHPNAKTSAYYKGRIKIKMMVQKRQVKKRLHFTVF